MGSLRTLRSTRHRAMHEFEQCHRSLLPGGQFEVFTQLLPWTSIIWKWKTSRSRTEWRSVGLEGHAIRIGNSTIQGLAHGGFVRYVDAVPEKAWIHSSSIKGVILGGYYELTEYGNDLLNHYWAWKGREVEWLKETGGKIEKWVANTDDEPV